MRLFSVGHSILSQTAFLALLREHQISTLVDIRRHPGSRHSPWFHATAMRDWLTEGGIAYQALAELGGRRGTQPVDPHVNAGWRNASFHNYADYTLSDEYAAGIARLLEIAQTGRTTVMCSEVLPWRCHRLLVSNTLVARGNEVWHLFADKAESHELGRWGAPPVWSDGRLIYPAAS